MSSRTRMGKIRKFDSATWWGEVDLGSSSSRVEFHATCYLGSSTHNLPKVGDRVQVIFSDTSAKRLLSISPHVQEVAASARKRSAASGRRRAPAR